MEPSDLSLKKNKTNFFSPNNLFIIDLFASLAGLLFGLDIGVMAGANDFIKIEFSANDHDIEKIVSIMMFGAAFGALICGWASAKFGRNRCLIVSATFFIAASIGCSLSNSVSDLIMWRFVLGFAIGIASMTAPLYLAEIAPEEKRGAMISTYQLMITVGIFLAFISDTIFGYYGAWRWMLGILAVPATIFLLGLLILPNSPRWLLMHRRRKEAYNVLSSIRNNDNTLIKREIKNIEMQLENSQKGFYLFLYNSNFKRSVLLGICLQIIQQFTGMNVIMYYAPRIFANMGYHGHARLWFTALVGLVNVFATFLAIGICDKSGRKPILYIGFTMMAIGLGSVSFLLDNNIQTNSYLQYCCVTMLLMFIIGFAMSAGPLIWTICSEIQPLQGRDFGIAVSTVVNWLANFWVGFTFLTLINTFGASHTILLYACLNLIFIVFIFAFVPETSNISLEQIEKNLMEGQPLRKIGR